jgi:phosphatidate cytidylyltransferase
MSNLLKRTLTGVAIVTIVPGAVMLGVYGFMLLCLIINFFALQEFYRLFQINSNLVRKTLGIVLSVTLLISTFCFVSQVADWKVLLINLPLISVIFITELYLKSDTPFSNLAFIFLGIIYITLPVILLFSCGFGNTGYRPNVILGYFFLLWANDTGAFVFGSLFGEYPLFKRISPKKTLEGSAGGAFLVVVIVFVNHTFFTEVSLLGWIIIGLIVIVAGTFGDLVKSLMKRSLNVKDSGDMLPGHGGVLDRFDSLLGSVPIVFSYLAFQL